MSEKYYQVITEQSLDCCDKPTTEIYITEVEEHITEIDNIHTSSITIAQVWAKELADDICDFLNSRVGNCDNMSWPIGNFTTNERRIGEPRLCSEETSGAAKNYMKSLPIIDWADEKGDKLFGWKGTCDACGEQKARLTVIKSAALSGVTICESCRGKQ